MDIILNITKIPHDLRHLMPMVEKWGIADDGERDSKVYNSSLEELKDLASSLRGEDDSLLDDWLCGPEATGPSFSNEYLAYTCYLMAFQYARQVLKNRISGDC